MDILTVAVRRADDPDGDELVGVLSAVLAHERARRLRLRWAAVLAVTAGLAWLSTASPAAAGPLRTAAMAVVALRTLAAVMFEAYRYRRRSQALAAHPGAALATPRSAE
jgi:hypothetical protein